MKRDYWDSLKGTELINKHGARVFVADIDPAIGFTIKGLDDGKDRWCDSPGETYLDTGTYEEHFNFALNCILSGIMPTMTEFNYVFPSRSDLGFLDRMLGGVGECPF